MTLERETGVGVPGDFAQLNKDLILGRAKTQMEGAMVQEKTPQTKKKMPRIPENGDSSAPPSCMCACTYVSLNMSMCVQVHMHTRVETRTALTVSP